MRLKTLWVLLVFCLIPFISADDEETLHPIQIVIRPTNTDHLSEHDLALLDELKSNLDSEFTPTVETSSINFEIVEYSSNADIEIKFITAIDPNDDSTFISVTSNTRRSPPLPIGTLIPHLELYLPIIANVDNENLYNATYQLVEYIASYISGNCEQMSIYENNLLNSLNQISTHNNSHIQAITNFYDANCLLVDKKYDEAKALYYSAMTHIRETDVPEWNLIDIVTNLAWTEFQLGNVEEAFTLLDLSIDNFEISRNVATYVMRAHLYAMNFDYDSAIEDMDTIISYMTMHLEENSWQANPYIFNTSPRLQHLYKFRGDIIMLIYEWNRALENYDKAIELAPDYAEAYYRRGILLYTMVERENAIEDFETYMEFEPEGEFAESAQAYINSIQTEIQALGG